MNAFDQAAANLEAAKIAEAAATEARRAAEDAVIRLMPTKDEGSVTERGLRYKVTVTYGMTRSLDVAALDNVRASMPPDLFEQAIEYAPKIKLTGLRYLRNNEPEAYGVLAQAITAKPAKPQVKIEAIDAQREAA